MKKKKLITEDLFNTIKSDMRGTNYPRQYYMGKYGIGDTTSRMIIKANDFKHYKEITAVRNKNNEPARETTIDEKSPANNTDIHSLELKYKINIAVARNGFIIKNDNNYLFGLHLAPTYYVATDLTGLLSIMDTIMEDNNGK